MLDGLALANVSAGFSGTFVVNGSPTKTQMVDGAGGRSQLATLTTAAIVLVVLLFLTASLQYMPDAVLASVVFLIGIELIDLTGMRKIWRSVTASGRWLQ
jgi:SulP family sulfate permease